MEDKYKKPVFAKKSYGQHFLKEEPIAERISDGLKRIAECEHIVEVGPGRGMLTKYLFKANYPPLTVVEADPDMVAYLGEHYPQLEGKIVHKDFLQVDLPAIFEQKQFAVIGNFPYNISSQILFKMIEYRQYIPEMVGMFQKEVAERTASGPGSKEYGILSVLVQAYFEVDYMFTVKPGSFNPPPKVMSAVIRLRRKENQDLGCDEVRFKKIVKAGFGQRRKMLRNTLKDFFTEEQMQADPIFMRRPEQLGLSEFVYLTNLGRV